MDTKPAKLFKVGGYLLGSNRKAGCEYDPF